MNRLATEHTAPTTPVSSKFPAFYRADIARIQKRWEELHNPTK